MIEKFLNEYNEEFGNIIQPERLLSKENTLYLEYKNIFDSEMSEIISFCTMYKLKYEVFNSHNSIFIKLTN